MIVYDLKCPDGHTFEAWFASSDEYDAQVAAGAVACPVCGGTNVHKAIMAPRVNSGLPAAPTAPCGLPQCGQGACTFNDA